MINNLVLSGYIANDGELFKKDDLIVYSNTIAINEFYKGEERPLFIKFKCFKEKKAEHLAKYLKKGFKVTLSGTISANIYEKNGVSVQEILMKVEDYDIHTRFTAESTVDNTEDNKTNVVDFSGFTLNDTEVNNTSDDLNFNNFSVENVEHIENIESTESIEPDLTLIKNDTDIPFEEPTLNTNSDSEENVFLSMFKNN